MRAKPALIPTAAMATRLQKSFRGKHTTLTQPRWCAVLSCAVLCCKVQVGSSGNIKLVAKVDRKRSVQCPWMRWMVGELAGEFVVVEAASKLGMWGRDSAGGESRRLGVWWAEAKAEPALLPSAAASCRQVCGIPLVHPPQLAFLFNLCVCVCVYCCLQSAVWTEACTSFCFPPCLSPLFAVIIGRTLKGMIPFRNQFFILFNYRI